METHSLTTALRSVSNHLDRNPGQALNLDWVMSAQANTSAIERRTSTLSTRRSVKKSHQAAWLLRAVSCIDLTSLSGDDTEGRVYRLCDKAKTPIRADILGQLDFPKIRVGAVCVYHDMIKAAVTRLQGSGIPVVAVSTGFPAGLSPLELRIAEIKESVSCGADEIDIVINRKAFFEGDYKKVYEEIKALKDVCGEIHLKTILEIGELKTYENIKKASVIALCAGSDFIKTSTGKISNGSSREACLIMARTVREFESYGYGMRGIKVAGGIRDAKDAIRYLVIINEELGGSWLSADYFRFGASSLLDDVLKQIKKLKTNAYQSSYYFPRG